MAKAIADTRSDVAEELLLDYASGALPEPVSVLVATQLALRPDLRAAVAELEAVGGRLIEEIEPTDLSDDAFEAVLDLIGSDEASAPAANDDRPFAVTAPASAFDDETVGIVPEPLRSYLGTTLKKLAWKKRGPGIEEFRIAVPDERFEVSILRLKPGRSVPHHGHDGSELTLVLDGAFTDDTGRYARGDVAVNAEDDLHTPLADPELGCICLAVTGGALKFTNPLVRLYDKLTRD